MQKAQSDAESRWNLYRQMANMQYNKPEPEE
jgi:hypothetical protein